MPDTYPGSQPERHDAANFNGVIYRYTTRALHEREEGEIISDPESSFAEKSEMMVAGLKAKGVGEQRITVVGAIAQIDFLRRQLVADETPEEISDQI